MRHDRALAEKISAKFGMPPVSALRLVKARHRGILLPYLELEFDHRGIVSVADVLADLERYIGGRKRRSYRQYECPPAWALHSGSYRSEACLGCADRSVACDSRRVNADVHDIKVIFVDEPDDIVNPLGIKGLGEIGIVGVPAAIANAIYHLTGKRVRDLPITLDK
jgi:hypothetical protein